MKSENLTLEDMPFSRLIVESVKLTEIRREFAAESEKERRLAADFEYLTDLGWPLTEAGHYSEAKTILDKAVAALSVRL